MLAKITSAAVVGLDDNQFMFYNNCTNISI